MTQKIASALNVSEQFVSNVRVEGKSVEFDLNGVGYFAKLVRGQFKTENMRRASY